MIDTIQQLEELARRLEPGPAQRKNWWTHVTDYAEQYLNAIQDMPAYQPRPDHGHGLYESPITEEGMDIEQLLGLVHDHVDTVGINPTSGRFMGYIPGGGIYPAALGDFLAAVTNRYAGFFFASPGAVKMENLLLRWMAEVVGYPTTAAGHLASGGSLANLAAIVAARDAAGVLGERVQQAVVYTTRQVHHCIDKALRVAGLQRCIRRVIPEDDAYRMNPQALGEAIVADRRAGRQPWLVVASAGTTNTGAVDPLAEISTIAARHGVWFHVDGAYGAFFVLCPEGAAVLQGMEKSDSLVMDPHKTLFLPYGTGAVLVREGRWLYNAFGAQAAYMHEGMDELEELSPADLSPELTKHFRGLRLWLPLKLFGLAPFRAALSEKIHLARYFYEQIQTIDGFEVGPYPDLSVVIYRYVPARGDADAFNQRLLHAVQQDGRVFVSATRVDGRFVLRLAVSCFRTHLEHIDEVLAVLRRTVRQLNQA